MRKQIQHSSVVLALLTTVFAHQPAWSKGSDWPSESLTSAEDISFLSVAVSFEEQRRDIQRSGGQATTLRSRHLFGELSCDVFDFLTLNAGAGYAEAKPDKFEPQDDGDMLWLVGARLTFWEHIVDNPYFLANRLRFDTAISYWEFESELLSYDFDWNETRAICAFSCEFFVPPRRDGESGIPRSLIVSAGAVYSRIEGDTSAPLKEFSGATETPVEFEESDDWGGMLGIDLLVSDSLSLSVEGRFYGKATVTLGTAFHF